MDQPEPGPTTQGTEQEARAAVAAPPSSGRSPAGAAFRRGVWWAAAALLVAGVALIVTRPRPDKGASPPREGAVIDADITLITSDRTDVACLSDALMKSFMCGFSGPAAPRKLTERETLRPYMTVDRHLYLIPGLFLEPNIDRRVQAEPPRGPREGLRRFTARCRLKLVGRMEGFKLRWLESAPWSEPQTSDVATVERCQVLGDPPARVPG